jgi:hypothetical protein
MRFSRYWLLPFEPDYARSEPECKWKDAWPGLNPGAWREREAGGFLSA